MSACPLPLPVLVYTGKEAECCSDLVLGAVLQARLQNRGGVARDEVCFDSSDFLMFSVGVSRRHFVSAGYHELPSFDPSSAVITEKLSLQENSQD